MLASWAKHAVQMWAPQATLQKWRKKHWCDLIPTLWECALHMWTPPTVKQKGTLEGLVEIFQCWWRRPYQAEFLLSRGRGVLKNKMSAPNRHFSLCKINFVFGDTCNIGGKTINVFSGLSAFCQVMPEEQGKAFLKYVSHQVRVLISRMPWPLGHYPGLIRNLDITCLLLSRRDLDRY